MLHLCYSIFKVTLISSSRMLHNWQCFMYKISMSFTSYHPFPLLFSNSRLLSWPRPSRQTWRWRRPSRVPSRERTVKWFRLSPLWPPEVPSGSTQPRTLLYGMAWQVSMEQRRSTIAYSWTSNPVRKLFLRKTEGHWWNTGKKLFSFFPFFPANCSIHDQPDVAKWKCSQRTWKDYDSPKIHCGLSGGFHHRKDVTHNRLHSGIIVYPGRMLLL